MGQESEAHLSAALWQESFKLFFCSPPSISSFPASPCYCLTEPTASAQGSTKLLGARRQGILPAVLIACLHTQPCVSPSRTSGAGMFALHLCFCTWSLFFQNLKGTGCQRGGKANSTSCFQTPAPHITHSLFKCNPWKIRISITSILT